MAILYLVLVSIFSCGLGFVLTLIFLSSPVRQERRKIMILQFRKEQAEIQSQIDEIQEWRSRERPQYDFEDSGV